MPVPAAELVDRAWSEGWRPDPEIDIDEWADADRVLTSKSAHIIGPWVTEVFPHTREWMKNASPSSPVEETFVMASRQMSKTDGLILNTIGYWLSCRSGPLQLVLPKIEDAKIWRKQRLTPMIESCRPLRDRLRSGKRRTGDPARARDSSDTLFFIEYPGGTLRIGGANSSSSLRVSPARVVLCEELDEWTEDADGHGDPLAIVRKGAQNFPDRKILGAGNPGIRGQSRAEREFLRGDQRRYFIPCPLCAARGQQRDSMDILTWQGRDWFGAQDGQHHRIEWEKPVPQDQSPVAYMVCSRCGGRVDEHHKTWMLSQGEWRPTAVASQTRRSYQISGLYSPLGFLKWSTCADEFLKAADRPNELRSFVCDVLGETFEERSDKVQVSALLEEGRREDYGAEVPHDVGVLVSATDTQDDRLIHSVWGFGAGEECWLIDVTELEGDPRKGDDVWILHDHQLARLFRHRSGQDVQIRRAVVDSGGHATDAVYKYCASRRHLGNDRRVFAIFGDRTQQKPLVGTPKKTSRYGSRVFPLCVDSGRADVLSMLRIRDRGAGFIHLPKHIDEEWIRQIASTRSVWKRSGGLLVREWTKAYHPRDHLFDLAVYALAALRMLGPAFGQKLGAMAAALSEPVERPDGEVLPEERAAESSATPASPALQTPAQPRGSSWVQKARWR